MGDNDPAKWEMLEAYLFDHVEEGTDFSVTEYADATGIEVDEASGHIQNYLTQQRRKRSKALYMLHRVAGTRTRNARWSVGIRTKDAREVRDAFENDMASRIMQALVPDLRHLAAQNPRAAAMVDDQIHTLVEGWVKVLHGTITQALEEDDS